MYSVLQPPQPKPTDNELHWGNLHGSSQALAIINLVRATKQSVLIITTDIQQANLLQRELAFFNTDDEIPVCNFPSLETLPYDQFSPYQDLISERMLALSLMPNFNNGIIITALPTLMHRLPPKSYLNAYSLALSVGDQLDLNQFRHRLAHASYHHVEQVMQHGEFAIRGSILDIFPMGSQIPYRIDFFDNEIESIREFDPEDQRSIQKIDRIELLPAREFPLTEDSIKLFRTQWRAQFSGNPSLSPIYQSISNGEVTAGIEYYLSLFFTETATLFDYLPQHTSIIQLTELPAIAQKFWQEVTHRYEQLNVDTTRPLCEPPTVFLTPEFLFGSMRNHCQIHIHEQDVAEQVGRCNFPTEEPIDLRIDPHQEKPLKKLAEYIAVNNARVLIGAESAGRREVLLELLQGINYTPTQFNSWNDFLSSSSTLGITIAPIDRGLVLTDTQITLVSESQLFGAQVMQRRRRQARDVDPSTMIRSLTELQIGAPVVHIEHGVGRYQGLQIIKTGDIEGEYLTLVYAEDDKIYVPVDSLHLISRYTGMDAEHAPLHKLGNKSWAKAKKKSEERVRDVAAELLDVYSRRQASEGFAMRVPDEDFQKFRHAFPFEETPDQQQAIAAVINDMTNSTCMDRLVCGDVGFGKTEVAMQAAFLAVQNSKQVGILVPTTLLATQHEQNFKDRFADWPIRIASISRMRTGKEQEKILQDLADGKLDIVIGTHKLLQPSVKFHDLGLLVVDEEHRFGVRQKERIKAMRAHVDILTLTATPIPRTLNMAMADMRDLSIIATPPARRLAVKTFVHKDDSQLIREAMLRETMRGGQIYFLHNEVATIKAVAEKLHDILPQARIAIAHGQMRERELETVMTDFYHQRFNVLVCTTIIESGIDIPTANTIIINRADKFGLAQLHQIRGRVGRSHHQAYAYLLIPDEQAITKDAQKRLEAISHLEELGAGFQLATHDLEIRGAGELLGEEQSGHIQAVGFSLYMEMLEAAVRALKQGQEPTSLDSYQTGPEIDLHITALIPETYVPDVHLRLTLYKRLADCVSKAEIQEFKAELVDRFGNLPSATENLLQLSQLKLQAAPLGIKKIEVGTKFGYFHFSDKPNIDPAIIVHLIQQQSDTYLLQGADRLRFTHSAENSTAKIQMTLQRLQDLIKSS